MAFELGKLISERVTGLWRKVPVREAEAGLRKQATRQAGDVFGRDALLKSAVKKTDDAVGKLVKELPKATGEKPVTFLTYKAMDNELSPYIAQHLDRLERSGSGAGINVLAYTDGAGTNDTRKYFVQADKQAGKVTSPYQAVAEANTADAKTLEQAVAWAFGGDYPAKLRWLDLNDHGAGWYGILQDQTAVDPVRLAAMRKAILAGAGGKKLDLLTFDACLEASAEVSYEMRDVTGLMVASEDETFPLGMNYDQVLAELAKRPDMDAKALAKLVFDKVQKDGEDMITAGDGPGVKRVYQMSVIDTSKAGDVAKAVDGLAGALIGAMGKQRKPIVSALQGVKPFYASSHGGFDWAHRDLGAIAEALRDAVPDAKVKAAAEQVLKTVNGPEGAVLHQVAAKEQQGAARGMSIYMPLDGKVDPVYMDTAFAKDTRWATFLKTLG
ncbi:MAG: putative clostripain peptidase family [Cyanobacteria bacterium RYN_339]|nr:putative clostripain peptidase family [Cyanobacteria bacterium RYN_339]